MKPLLLLPLILILTACNTSKPQSLTHYEGIAMGMGYHVMVDRSKDDLQPLIDTTFRDIDTIFNNWNPHSEVSRLNSLAANEKVSLSTEMTTLLTQIDHLVTLSDGRFDPTVEPLQQIWKMHLRQGLLPPEELLDRVKPAVGWSNIHLNGNTFWKEHADTALDFGGIAKGYFVDLLTERLLASGYENIYVEWSGEIRTHGAHPEGRDWRIAITPVSGAPTTLDMNERAIATSGDYIQCWSVAGKTYVHIIDPRTKEPLTLSQASVASASVLAPSCAFADGVATTLMLFETPEAAQEWTQKLPHTECHLQIR